MAEPVTLSITVPEGHGKLTVDSDHPLVSPLRVAILKGRPPGKWFWFAVLDQATGECRVLGSFVHSPGDRLLFFAGASILVSCDRSNLQPGRLDHLTLDPPTPKGTQKSHVALLDGVRGSKYTSRPPDGHLFPWFTLLAPTLGDFAELPAELSTTFAPPRPDVLGFAHDLIRGPGLALAPLPTGCSDSFLQLDVWVGRTKDWRSLSSRPLAWAYKPDLVSNAPPGQQNINVIAQQVEFEPSVGLTLLCSRPRGNVAEAHILRPTVSFS